MRDPLRSRCAFRRCLVSLLCCGQWACALTAPTTVADTFWDVDLWTPSYLSCVSGVTYAWPSSLGDKYPSYWSLRAFLSWSGTPRTMCGHGASQDFARAPIPDGNFATRWVSSSGQNMEASVPVAELMKHRDRFGGQLDFMYTDDHFEVWFRAPDPNRMKYPLGIGRLPPELIYSTNPKAVENLWQISIEIPWAEEHPTVAAPQISDLSYSWGADDLGTFTALSHQPSRDRIVNVSGGIFPVYGRPLPKAPLVIQWKNLKGEQQSATLQLASLMDELPLFGNQVIIRLYQTHISVFWRNMGQHLRLQKPRRYAAPAEPRLLLDVPTS